MINILTDVVIYGIGFGCGWVTSRLFSWGFFRDSDSDDEEFDMEDPTSSEEESHLTRILLWVSPNLDDLENAKD
jgi:hypothetical protein